MTGGSADWRMAVGDLFPANDLIVQWTTTRGLTSHTWRIPLAPLALAAYVVGMIGLRLLSRKDLP
jgi:hypothetical protein